MSEFAVGQIVYWWSVPGHATAGEVLAIHGDCAWVLRRWQAHGKGNRFEDTTRWPEMRIPVTVTLERLRAEPLANHGHPGPLPHER
jgi:hypothetical protein